MKRATVVRHRAAQFNGSPSSRVSAPKRASFTATEAKNEFGLLLEKAIAGEAVVITKHETPKAVLISMDEYRSLKHSSLSVLDELTAEYDEMLAEMQTKKSRDAVRDLFSSTPEQLGKAAVKGWKR